jgi:hypothetical protein
MADRPLLTPDVLGQLLAKLDDVMDEAARLRRQVNRQLAEQRRNVQQKLAPPRKRARKVR